MHESLRLIPLLADAGLPMIFVTWPAMMIALIPTIAIEALLIQRRTHGPMGKTLLRSSVANAASTVLGIPMTWMALLAVEIFVGEPVSRVLNWDKSVIGKIVGFIIYSPWVMPSPGSLWVVPLAVLVLLVPFYFVSMWIERWVIQYMLTADTSDSAAEAELARSTVRTAVRDANLLSYGILFALTSIWLVCTLKRQ
jgi:hypothetical protein